MKLKNCPAESCAAEADEAVWGDQWLSVNQIGAWHLIFIQIRRSKNKARRSEIRGKYPESPNLTLQEKRKNMRILVEFSYKMALRCHIEVSVGINLRKSRVWAVCVTRMRQLPLPELRI